MYSHFVYAFCLVFILACQTSRTAGHANNSSRSQPAADKAASPSPTTSFPVSQRDIRPAAIDLYLSQSAPNAPAVAAMREVLVRARSELGVQFSDVVDCRGQVCKISLDISGEDANRMRRLSVRHDIELSYHLELGSRTSTLVIYSTAPGVRFRDILKV